MEQGAGGGRLKRAAVLKSELAMAQGEGRRRAALGSGSCQGGDKTGSWAEVMGQESSCGINLKI